MGGLILGLIASQSLMDLFAVITTGLGLWLLVKDQEKTFWCEYKNKFYVCSTWLLFLFFGLFLQRVKGLDSLSDIFIAPNKSGVGFKSLKDFLWMLQLPIWSYLWLKGRWSQRWIKIVLILLLLVSLYSVIIYILGFDPLLQHWSDRTENARYLWRSGGLFSNAMALAQSYGPLCMLLLPLTVFYLVEAYHNFLRYRWSGLFPTSLSWLVPLVFLITLLAVLFTFTRGVWMALVLTTLLASFIHRRKWALSVLVVMILGGATLLSVWPKFRERTLLVFDTQKGYDSERLVVWKTNWFIFTENPIAGIGYSENHRRLREYYDYLGVPKGQFEGHAHNQFLHFLAGTGLIGFLFYLGWCIYFLKITYFIYRHSFLENRPVEKYFGFGLFLAQVSFHIGSLTESNFSIAKNRLLMVILWSLALAMYYRLNHSRNSSLK